MGKFVRWFLGLTPEPVRRDDPDALMSLDDILLRLGMEDGYLPADTSDEDDTNNFYMEMEELSDD